MRGRVNLVAMFVAAGTFLYAGWAMVGSANGGGSLIASSPRSSVRAPDQGMVLYVSTEGDDAWSGTLPQPNPAKGDGPFRTLAGARNSIRRMKARGPLTQPVTVQVRGGEYVLPEPLVFTPEDSGTTGSPITYEAYPGETPALSGGRRISGWQHATEADRGVAEGELWMTRVAGVKEGDWYFRQLFVNGERRPRARTPNTGFFLVEGDISPAEPASFTFRQGDIRASWAVPGDVEVVALQKWAEFRLPIRAVNEGTRTVTLGRQCALSNREPNARYWVENTLDALDAPGEWYLDRRSGVVYYRPLPGEDVTTATFMAPVLQQLVRFEGDVAGKKFVENIRLRGFTFSYTDWSLPAAGYADPQAAYDIPAAFEAVGALGCVIENCKLTHLGQYALAFGRGSKGNRILASEMTDLGAGGVKIGEPEIPQDDADSVTGNIVSDNHIHDIGVVYPAAVGVWIGQSSGNTVSHNHIHDTFYTGISVGWTWGYGPAAARDNLIEFNHIHDIGRGTLSDLGGIYTLGVQSGTVIRNNVFHDIASYSYGGWGIYTDEGSSQILIENNVVYRTKSGSFHQHYGRENIIRNNIFAFSRGGQIIRNRREPHLSFTFERNIVYWKEGPLLGSLWDDDQFHLDWNLYFQVGDGPIQFASWSFAEWQKRGQDVHSMIADPSFVDPEHGDFTLREGSPASEIGFRPIDFSAVGPRRR